MNPIIWLINTVIDLYIYIIIGNIILSLLISFNIVNRYQPFVQQIGTALNRLTEPALSRIRKYLPPLGGLDLSPIVLIIGLNFIRYSVMYIYVKIL